MGVWNGSQRMWDSFQTLALMPKNLPFIVFGTLATYVYIKPAYTHACMHTQSLGFRGLYFIHKRVIFFIKTFLKSIDNLIGP